MPRASHLAAFLAMQAAVWLLTWAHFSRIEPPALARWDTAHALGLTYLIAAWVWAGQMRKRERGESEA